MTENGKWTEVEYIIYREEKIKWNKSRQIQIWEISQLIQPYSIDPLFWLYLILSTI